LKEIKLHNQSQAHLILKDIPPGFKDLIEKMVVFNPYKRITIEEILNHEVVKAFHKPEE
jgi:serine/threonine protein kinase